MIMFFDFNKFLNDDFCVENNEAVAMIGLFKARVILNIKESVE